MTTLLDTVGALHPAYTVAPRPFQVVSVETVAPEIVHVEFVPLDGGPLTAYEAGSHLIVEAGPNRNAYSLTGDGSAPTSYGISVLRHQTGGGSQWIHDHLVPGAVVTCEGPRSAFPARPEQTAALLVAGGVGITPILSHARSLARWGGTADIVYSYRPGSGAHLAELRDLAKTSGFSLTEATDVPQTQQVLADRFADQPIGAHAYACGPIAMIDTYLELGRSAGWPVERLHLERFEAPELDPGVEFDVTVAGTRLTVAPGVSVLQTLLDAGHEVPNLCRQGVCGECRIPVKSGVVEHRDFVLTDAEKKAGDSMMCCVSRGTDLEVDL